MPKMNVSTKLRHRIALAIASAMLIVALLSFADFSGQPAPRWREILLGFFTILAPIVIFVNVVLDRRDKDPRD
jgi:hypothetical protein